MIIKTFKVDKDLKTKNLKLILDRKYPRTYDVDDEYKLERYEIDVSDPKIRFELKNAIKAQSVLQYMSDNLAMSTEFYLMPINNYDKLQTIVRYAKLPTTPEFVDITNFITNQNTVYFDKGNKENFMYLYRIVYKYSGRVYSTEYIAGFEQVNSSAYTSEISGEPIYKTAISDSFLAKLFGDSGANLKNYMFTLINEKRTKYRQLPAIFKFPTRRINFRFKGPTEDYKLKLGFHELYRNLQVIDKIQAKIVEEVATVTFYIGRLNERALQLNKSSEKQLVQFLEDLYTFIDPSLIYRVIIKDSKTHRILNVTGLHNSYNIPDLMLLEGIYILTLAPETCELIYNYILDNNKKQTQDIYIAWYKDEKPRYRIGSIYE